MSTRKGRGDVDANSASDVDDTANYISSGGEEMDGRGPPAEVDTAFSTKRPLVAAAPEGNAPTRQRRDSKYVPYYLREYPTPPDVVQYVQMPKSTVNHTYLNFSETPKTDLNYSIPGDTSQMTFHEKMYTILSHPKLEYGEAIRWCRGGRAFEIVDVTALTRQGLLTEYFQFGTMPQFRRQLLCHGYRRLLRDVRSETYYSEVSAPSFRDDPNAVSPIFSSCWRAYLTFFN